MGLELNVQPLQGSWYRPDVLSKLLELSFTRYLYGSPNGLRRSFGQPDGVKLFLGDCVRHISSFKKQVFLRQPFIQGRAGLASDIKNP